MAGDIEKDTHFRGGMLAAENWLGQFAVAIEKEAERHRETHPDWASIERQFGKEARAILAKITRRRIELENAR